MPPTNGVVDLLVPKQSLSRADWCAIIDARIELIKPYLDRITLQHLRDMRCMMLGSGTLYGLGDAVPQYDGLFYYDIAKLTGRQAARRPEGAHEVRIWRLDRDGNWWAHSIGLMRSRRNGPHDEVIYNRICALTTTNDLLGDMRDENAPEAIFEMLGANIASIINRRRVILDQLQHLESELKLQDRVLAARRR